MFGCSRAIVSEPLPPQSPKAVNLLFIVHGHGETPEDWPADLVSALSSRFPDKTQWDIVTYDWDRYSRKRFSASKRGLIIGRRVGETLASSKFNYRTIHFIGHSVGSFLIHAACNAYREAAENPARLHVTFLDPFTLHGFFGWGFGWKQFGKGADFAEVYTNTDDIVPTSNGIVENAHNFDVTKSSHKQDSKPNMHWWPVDYYIMSVRNTGLPFGYQLAPMSTGIDNEAVQKKFPAGETTIVP